MSGAALSRVAVDRNLEERQRDAAPRVWHRVDLDGIALDAAQLRIGDPLHHCGLALAELESVSRSMKLEREDVELVEAWLAARASARRLAVLLQARRS